MCLHKQERFKFYHKVNKYKTNNICDYEIAQVMQKKEELDITNSLFISFPIKFYF